MGSIGKAKLHWYGFIYEIVDEGTGITMTGKSTAPHAIRKKNYYTRAINQKSQYYSSEHLYLNFDSLNILEEVFLSLGHTSAEQAFSEIKGEGARGWQIHALMFQHLNSLGLLRYKADGSVDRNQVDYNACYKALDSRFKFNLKKLVFSEAVLRDLEISRIKIQQRKGVSINRDVKSRGPPSPNHLLSIIIKCISINLDIDQMVDLLANVYKYKPKNAKGSIRKLIEHNFGGIKEARAKFFFPVLGELRRLGYSSLTISKIFAFEALQPYLEEIDELFLQGYNPEQIARKVGLNRIIPDADVAIKEAVMIMHAEHYSLISLQGWKPYNNLRRNVFRELFLDEIKNGAFDFETLRRRFKAYAYTGDYERTHKMKDIFRSYFYQVFGQGIKEVFNKYLTTEEKNRAFAIYFISQHIIKKTGEMRSGYNIYELVSDLLGLLNLNINDIIALVPSLADSIIIDKLLLGIGLPEGILVAQHSESIISRLTGYTWDELIQVAQTYKVSKTLSWITDLNNY